MRDELLHETLFIGLDHARSVIAAWVTDYNAARPHSAMGYQTPAAYAAQLTAMNWMSVGGQSSTSRSSPFSGITPPTRSTGPLGRTRLLASRSTAAKRSSCRGPSS